MKNKILDFVILMVSLLVLLFSLMCRKMGNSILFIICLIIGCLILLFALSKSVKYINGKSLMESFKGRNYERLFAISMLLIYVGVILNILDINFIGVPMCILGIGLIFYSNEMEKEFKNKTIKQKATEKIEEVKKDVDKKVKKVKKEVENKTKKYKKHKK